MGMEKDEGKEGKMAIWEKGQPTRRKYHYQTTISFHTSTT